MISLCGIQVEVVKATGIIAADKSGTSDPYCKVKLVQANGKPLPKEEYKTKTIQRTLDPEWNETFKMGEPFKNMPALKGCKLVATLYDMDKGMFDKDDDLGTVEFGPIEVLAKTKKLKADLCFTLQSTAAMVKAKETATGELHLRMKLLGDPDLVYEEFGDEAKTLPDHEFARDASKDVAMDELHAKEFEGKPCNELHLTLVSAKGLLVMDTAVFGKGSSDPYVNVSVNSVTQKSTVKKKSLDPEWHEMFVLPVDDPACKVTLQVMDYDLVGANDFMGKTVIPLAEYGDKLKHNETFDLTNEAGGQDQGVARGSITVTLWWKHSPELQKAIEMDFSDDKEEDEIERKAKERADAIAAAKLQAKEDRKRAAREARLKLEYEEKQHQYDEEMTGMEEDFFEQSQLQYEADQQEGLKKAGVRQWEEAMQKAEHFGEELVEYDEWFSTNSDEIDFTRQDYDDWASRRDPFTKPTFEEWRDAVDLREVDVLLQKMELRVTAAEFVERYRQAKPDATVDIILGLLRFEADPLAEQEAMAKTLDGKNHFSDITGEPEEEEEEEETEDARVARLLLPNELCIALVRARALVAADVSLLGTSTSDPMVTFEVDGEQAMSQVIKKSLNPIWREKFFIPLHHFNSPEHGHTFNLKATVEDVDLIGANDFLGATLPIDITSFNKRWSKPTWYTLADEDGKFDQKKPRGAVELALRLRHNASLLEKPLISEITEVDDLQPEPEEYMDKEPNELRLTLWRARELQIMDTSMFGGGGSSDPLVRFKVVHEMVTSETKKKNLNPEWGESWKLKADAPDGILEVVMEDYDVVSGNDFMGKVMIPLSKLLKKRKPVRRWFRLGDKSGKRIGPSRGDIDLQLRWCHNPKLVEPEEALTPEQALRPPKGERKATKGKIRNELLVTVVQARNLPVMDKNLFSAGGSSDPYITLTVADGGDRAKTTVKKRNLNPVYKETFKLACPQDLDASVEVLVQDYDVAGADDFMGKVNIPLASMAAGNAHRAWYTFGDEKTGRPDGVSMRGQVEIVLRWKHNPDFAEGEPLEEFDGDEYPDKKPNELRVGLIRARNLAVMDKSVLGGKGSSDPIVTVRVGAHEHVSPLKKKTLAPRWNWRCNIPAVNPKNVLLETKKAGDEDDGKKKKKKKKKDKGKKKREKKGKKDTSEEVKAEQPGEVVTVEDTHVHDHEGLECVKLSESDAEFHLEIIVDDWDLSSGNDFMGRCVIPIKPLKHKKAVRKWYTLAPEATGDTLWPDLEKFGEVELLLKWWYNPALDYSDLEDPNTVDLHPDKFPNEMKVALLRARNLLVMDKNMFTGKGTSDPVVKLSVGTASESSTTKYKELEPEWNERFLLSADHLSTELDVLVEDVDALSSNDFMGRVKIPLAPLANKKPVHAWYPLGGKDGDEDDEPRGEVEIICRWWYNPALEPVPLPLVPEETTEAITAAAKAETKYGKRLPNELRVAVIRGARLPVMDTSLLGGGPGTADPFVKLEVTGFEKRTTVKPKDLNPVWGEKFVLGPLQYEVGHVLKCIVFDYDVGSGNDFMGQVNIPLVDLVSRVPVRKWYRLTDRATAAKGAEHEDAAAAGPDLGRLEIWLRYAYNPLHDPTWVEPPILVESFTSTALDLPTLPPEITEKKQDDSTVETPRWFYLETPRRNDEEEGRATIEDDPSAVPLLLPPMPGDGQLPQIANDAAVRSMALQPPFDEGEQKSHASFENRSVQFMVPRGPYNEVSLKDLFDARGIHNRTRVWTEGMDDWTLIDEMQGLKRRLWAYPEIPDAKPHEANIEADKANKRWFFVDEHLGEEGVEPEIVGPESLDELRERFEAAAVGDHTMAWREGYNEWQALDDFHDAQVGRAAGWKPRREHDGLHLPRFDLSMECSNCGGVATLHSFDALGNKKRAPPPSGRMKSGSTTDMAEILPDFLWIGNFAASRKKHLENTALSHIINCTEDIEDALGTRDLVEKPSERATICYLSVPIPDVIDENWDDAVDEDGDDEEDLAHKEALRAEQRKRGLNKDGWYRCLNRCFDFIESAERLEGRNCRVMIHSSRGNLRPAVLVAAYLIRKFGLRKNEALDFVEGRRKAFVGELRLTHGAIDALDEYEAEYALGRFFCDDCFDEHRYGREDTAMSLVIDAAALKLRQSDVTMVDLDLRGEPIIEGDVAVLADSLTVTHCTLIEVDLSGSHLGDSGMETMCKGLATCTSIERMVLQYTGIGDDGVKHVANLIGFDTGLKHPVAFLDLGFNRISYQGAGHLAHALHLNESLTYLDIRSNQLGDAGGVALSKALCDPDYESYLQSLIESGAGDSAPSVESGGTGQSSSSLSQVEFLRRYKRNTGLTYLNLVSNSLGQLCCRHLCEVLKMNSTLVALDLAFNPMLGSHEVKTLANFIRLYSPPIEVLSVGQMVFGDDVSAAFAKVLALEDTRLRTLALPRNRLLSTSAKRLAQSLVRNTVLTSLALPQNPLGSKGAGYLANMLEHNSTIRYLDLESAGFDKPAADALGRAISKNATLTQVDLSDNNMGAQGIRYIAEALHRNHTLKLIRLDGVSAGIVGAEFLARALARNDTLISLSFANNNIRNPGAKAFANALFENITLQSIDLSFNGFDSIGGGNIVSALATNSDVDRDHNTLELSVDMVGNVGCEDLLPPKLARSKRRWDFLPATRKGRLLV
jgi:Ca2+-dependent lipid-binding protein/Ran GTPase-activating protein (RanGAP) involved in mRNA processing and transport